jgi:hypothetical protein
MANETIKPGVTKTESSIIENGVLIQNITVRPVQRTNLDVEKWRNYHQQAEMINGTRVMLYDLYSDALVDGFLKRLIAKRVLAVTKNKLKYIDSSGKEIKGANELIKTAVFRKLRKRIQLYKAWGIAVIELNNLNGQLHIFDVPKKNIHPADGKIVHEQYGTEGDYYRQPPYNSRVVEIGDYDDLGFLLECAVYVIYKRGSMADAANFIQIFGQPFREVRYDGFNEAVRLQLDNAMEKAGSAAYAILPRDAEIKFHEAKNSAGSSELFETFRKAMNEEMSVTVLGATETTTSSKSSGYAQSETHMKTVEEVAQDDKVDELAILNEKVLPVLVYLGLLANGGSFAYDEPVNVDSADRKMKIAEAAKRMGVPVSDEYIYEITGIPKPDNYEELKLKIDDEKALQQQQAADNEEPPVKANKKPTAKNKQLSLENEIKKILTDFFHKAPYG